MSKLLVKHMHSKGCTRMTVLNRSLPRAEALAEEFPEVQFDIRLMGDLMKVRRGAPRGGARGSRAPAGGASPRARGRAGRRRPAAAATCAPRAPPPRTQPPTARRPCPPARPPPPPPPREQCVEESDLIFAASGSEELLVHKEDIEGMPAASEVVGGVRRFVDISVPRNIAPALNELDGAIVYNVDDLKEVRGRWQLAAASVAGWVRGVAGSATWTTWRRCGHRMVALLRVHG